MTTPPKLLVRPTPLDDGMRLMPGVSSPHRENTELLVAMKFAMGTTFRRVCPPPCSAAPPASPTM